MSFSIRPYQPKDVDAVYEVCLKTGDAGQDATHLYKDPKALGHLYTGPYVTLEPSLAFVLEDGIGVCGYVLGALDTKTFRERFVSEWLPPLQSMYPDPKGDEKTLTPDEQIYHEIHHPWLEIHKALEPYPSHLHIDLLPRAQGQGNGTHMMTTLLNVLREKGSRAVHLGTNPRNERAFVFYKKIGFHVIEDAALPERTIYMGLVFE
jgi:ribosomal protein S18 acetylase RimI-like enzyme